MNGFRTSVSSNKLLARSAALGVVGLLWIGYTALQTLFVVGRVPEPWSAVLGFVLGIAGVVALRAAGFSWAQLFLRVAPLSRGGLAVLAAVLVFALVVVLPFGTWQGWNWAAELVYGLASGVSQELFFRTVLLPALLLTLKAGPRLALVLHAALFGLWHIGPFFCRRAGLGGRCGGSGAFRVRDRVGLGGEARRNGPVGDGAAQPDLGHRRAVSYA